MDNFIITKEKTNCSKWIGLVGLAIEYYYNSMKLKVVFATKTNGPLFTTEVLVFAKKGCKNYQDLCVNKICATSYDNKHANQKIFKSDKE